MTEAHAVTLEKNPQGRIFLLVLALHGAILYGVFVQKHPLHLHEPETRVDLIWIRPPPRAAFKPAPAPPAKSMASAKTPALAIAQQHEARRPEAEAAPPADNKAANTEEKHLDLQKVLSEVAPTVRTLDGDQPAAALQAGPMQATFEAKLAKVLANSTPPPKFYEGARIETISTGPELDAGVIKYKITTFLGKYCVTYKDGAQVYVGTCPLTQF